MSVDRITGFDSRDRGGAKRAPTNGARVVSRQVRAAPRRCACGFAPMTRLKDFAFLPRQAAPLNSRFVMPHCPDTLYLPS